MEQELELRDYIFVLTKYWYWIIGLTVAAAAAAFIRSSFTPSSYKATALVTATVSQYELQFDDRFRNVPDSAIQALLQNQYRTYPTLATSDELLQQVGAQVNRSLNQLKGMSKAQADNSSPNLLALTVTGQNPEEAAAIANLWAELFVAKINALFGDDDKLEQFDQQQKNVAQSLAAADAALTAFREENGFGFEDSAEGSSSSSSSTGSSSINELGLIGQRLESKTRLLTDYEADLVRLHQIAREVELLSETVTANSSPTLIAGLLSEMINTGVVQSDAPPYQIKLESVDPVASLEAMAQAAHSRITAIEAETETLEAEIAVLQVELAAKQEELAQLIRDRDLKAETYAVISRKVQEAQIDASGEGSSGGKVAIASRASVPTSPIGTGRLRNTVLAGLLGLMASVFGVFLIEWWRAGSS